MNKQKTLEFAVQWGYVLVYSEYSRKVRSQTWVVKVPTTALKSRPSLVRSVKILEGSDLNELLEKTKEYFGDSKFPIKVFLREKNTQIMKMNKKYLL
jgi:hypothetical protein